MNRSPDINYDNFQNNIKKLIDRCQLNSILTMSTGEY